MGVRERDHRSPWVAVAGEVRGSGDRLAPVHPLVAAPAASPAVQERDDAGDIRVRARDTDDRALRGEDLPTTASARDWSGR
jgi:hypothetical protein